MNKMVVQTGLFVWSGFSFSVLPQFISNTVPAHEVNSFSNLTYLYKAIYSILHNVMAKEKWHHPHQAVLFCGKN